MRRTPRAGAPIGTSSAPIELLFFALFARLPPRGAYDVSPAHLHLLLNHIPILGTLLFAPLVLLWGLWRRWREVTQVGVALTVLLALAAVPVYLTGESAEEQLEGRQPVARSTTRKSARRRALRWRPRLRAGCAT